MGKKGVTGCYDSRGSHLFLWLFFGVLSLVLAGTPGTSLAENEYHISNEASVTYNDVSGPGSKQSSLSEGFHYIDAFNLSGNGQYVGFDYNYNLGLKATNDRQMDVKDISLTNLQGRATNKVHTMNIGDTFESFSQYSLSSALKGVSYRYANSGRRLPEATVVYGIAYGRWDTFWGNRSEVGAVERQVWGGKLKYDFLPELSAGLSAVKSVDHMRLFTEDLYDNNLYTLDWEYNPIKGLTIRGESSVSDTEVEATTGDTRSLSGSAHRIEAIGSGGPSKVTIDYERVSPEFTTLMGSATPDREKVKAKWRYKYDKNLSANFGFLWYRDNLNDAKAYTTDHYKPEVGFTLKRLFKRQYAILDMLYKPEKSQRRDGSGPDTTDTLNHVLTMNYRDRYGMIQSDLNLGYTRYSTEENVRDSNEYLANINLSTRKTYDRYILKPAVYLGAWTSKDELADSRDKIYEYSLNMGLDLPDKQITSNIRFGQNRLEKSLPGSDDSTKSFLDANVYYTPPFLAKLNYGMLYLRVMVNNYRYTSTNNDFRETSITSGVNIQF